MYWTINRHLYFLNRYFDDFLSPVFSSKLKTTSSGESRRLVRQLPDLLLVFAGCNFTFLFPHYEKAKKNLTGDQAKALTRSV